MNRTAVFILGLAGSVFGILGSLLWVFMGTSFWAHAFIGIDNFYGDDAYGLGIIISLFQLACTFPFFIVTLIKSLPDNLEKNLSHSSKWFLAVGILTLIFNLFLFIPSVLLIIAGAMNLKQNKHLPNEHL